MHLRPWIIAHRGASRAFRENTFAAFDAAVLAGVDAIELDLQLSKDEVPVAYHDQTLHRVNRTRRRISHYDVEQLRNRDFDAWFDPTQSGNKIPTLDEILIRYAPRVILMLELKTDAYDRSGERNHRLATGVAKRVVNEGLDDRVYILSFAPALLDVARQVAPALRCILTLPAAPEQGADVSKIVHDYSGLCLPGRHVTVNLAQALHGLDKELFCYRCDTAQAAGKALRANADGLMADDPIWLESFVEEQRAG